MPESDVLRLGVEEDVDACDGGVRIRGELLDDGDEARRDRVLSSVTVEPVLEEEGRRVGIENQV